VSYSSTLLIEELNNDGGSPRRIVTLVGPSLPFMGAMWGFENELVTTWYNGNPAEATQQILVPKELPSAWEGEWNRTLMGKVPAKFQDQDNTIAVIDPIVLRDLVEDIGRQGLRLRVSWIVDGDRPDQRSKTVREGRMKKAEFKHTRMQDIAWSIEFHWLGRGRAQQRVVSVRDDSQTAALAALNADFVDFLAAAKAADFINSLPTTRLSATTVTLGQLEAMADAPNRILTSATRSLTRQLNTFKDAVALGKKFVTMPQQLANTTVDFARNSLAIANRTADTLSRIPAEQTSFKSKVSDVTRSASYFGRNVDATRRIARRAYEFDVKVRAGRVTGALRGELDRTQTTGRPSDVLATYVTKQGDTPQRLSMKFYQTPDHAVDILRTNRLPDYQTSFPKGKILIIPNLKTTRSS
jgi:hypothetical protein